jgi:hypothetical protein
MDQSKNVESLTTFEKKDRQKCKWSKECTCSNGVKNRYEKFAPLLRKIHQAPPKKRISILKRAPSCFIRFLSECGLNVLKGNLELTDDQYAKLKPYKKVLLSVSDPTQSMNDRRKFLLKKKGGLVPLIIPVLATFLASLAGEAIGKAIS